MYLQSQGEIVDVEMARNPILGSRADFRVGDGTRKFLKAFHDQTGLPERSWYKIFGSLLTHRIVTPQTRFHPYVTRF